MAAGESKTDREPTREGFRQGLAKPCLHLPLDSAVTLLELALKIHLQQQESAYARRYLFITEKYERLPKCSNTRDGLNNLRYTRARSGVLYRAREE